MTRITVVAFVLLTGFFYATGKPVDETGPIANTFADLAKQKTVFAQSPTAILQGYTSVRKGKDVQPERLMVASTTSAAIPDLPTRNPRRVITPPPGHKVLAYNSALTSAKIPPVAKSASGNNANADHVVDQAKNKTTAALVKPLAVSYQQRYVKKAPPVLGPRLTAVLLKRELRRVGCYRGNVTGKWEQEARSAIEAFNLGAGTRLASAKPAVASLEKIQKMTGTVCREKPVTGRAIVAINQTGASSIKAATNANPWRTKVKKQTRKYKKTAYQFLPVATSPGYKTIGSIGNIKTKNRAKTNRLKRRAIAKRKKARKIRVAKRKARRKTAVRSWKRTYRRKKFGFRRVGGEFTLGN